MKIICYIILHVIDGLGMKFHSLLHRADARGSAGIIYRTWRISLLTSESRSRTEYVIQTDNIIVLDHFFNLTKKSNLIGRLKYYDFTQFLTIWQWLTFCGPSCKHNYELTSDNRHKVLIFSISSRVVEIQRREHLRLQSTLLSSIPSTNRSLVCMIRMDSQYGSWCRSSGRPWSTVTDGDGNTFCGLSVKKSKTTWSSG